MDETAKRQKIRDYFAKPTQWPQSLIGLGILAGACGLCSGSDDLAVVVLGMIVGAALASVGVFLALRPRIQGVPDEQIDEWLEEDLAALVPKAMSKAGLDSSEVKQTPLVIRGPIYWQTTGVPATDVVYKKGKDGVARFGIYHVTVIFLTEERMTSYATDFNFLKNVALNESTTEYFYQDVVAVSTREVSTSYTLPNKQSLVRAQAFSVQVPSGDAITVVIAADKLEQITRSRLPETGADRAVDTIRAMLRSKKGSVRIAQE